LRLKFPFFNKKKSSKDLDITRFVLIRFGYKLDDITYFNQAITHKSLLNQTADLSNERLEFLGDAVLDAVIAEYLFHRFPNEDEGYLTKIKSKVVSRKTLSEIGEQMDLRTIIRYNKQRTINLATIEGNAFEALMGAIYLDGGYVAVKKSIENHIFRKYLDLNRVLEEEIDFKSKLFIWTQKKRLKLEFIVLKEENLGSNWSYTIGVLINETDYGRGFGSSKKMAEQAAAKETLILMGEI
jgi:ribonuclease-3